MIGRLNLRYRTNLPGFFVKRVMSNFPGLLITLITRRDLVRVLLMRDLPFEDHPDKRVRAINRVARITLFKRVALPSINGRILKCLAIGPTRAICFLTNITYGNERTRALTIIVKVLAARTGRFVPESTRDEDVATRMLTRRAFVRVIIANEGQYVGHVGKEDTCRLRNLIRDRAFLCVIRRALGITRYDVTFITIMSILLSARLLRDRCAASARRSFLLRAIFPIATVGNIHGKAIRLKIRLVINVRRVRLSATRISAPCNYVCLVVRVKGFRRRQVAILVRLTFSERTTRILDLMINGLLAVRKRYLNRVTMAMGRACNARVCVTI